MKIVGEATIWLTKYIPVKLTGDSRWLVNYIPWVEKKKKKIFPCKSCLLFPNCSKICDKIEMDNDKIRAFLRQHKCCPDCGTSEFYEGPSGGLCTNFQCAGCGHWFNIGAGGMVAERIRV